MSSRTRMASNESKPEGRVWWKNAEACQDVSSEERICIPKIGSAATLDDWIFIQFPFLPCEKIMKQNLWMASGFDTEFNRCFPVDFSPPPSTTPKNICSEGWWTSFLLESPRSCQEDELRSCHVGFKRKGWGSPKALELNMKLQDNDIKFPQDCMGIFGLAIWKCFRSLEDGCGIWCYFSDWRGLELDWDETKIRLRDDAIRPNWVLRATARRSWKSVLPDADIIRAENDNHSKYRCDEVDELKQMMKQLLA